ncbi:MAG: hypothetical protein ACRD8U_04925, partial [Pyrinomonadaceae bacterium]
MTQRLWILATTMRTGSLTLLLIAMGCGQGVTPQRSLEPPRSSPSNEVVSQPNKTLDQDGPQTESTSNKLKCSIDVDERTWSKGKPAVVSIVVENVSGGKLDMKVIPAFFFVLEGAEANVDYFSARRNQYWGPVDIKEN